MRAGATVPVTALGRRAFRPTWELALALLLHALVLGAILLGERWTRPEAPLIDPRDVTMVTAVALPKQQGLMPDRATRAPDPPPPGDRAAPPPPPTASDMALHEPEAPKKGGSPTRKPRDRSREREELLESLRRQALVESLRDESAPVGARDRPRTSPDGVDWEDAVLGGGPNGIQDPELARYVSACRAAIMPHWTPLPSTVAAHPDYEVAVRVPVRADGGLGTPEIVRGSGDPAFDRSALMAVAKTGRLPPPPARFRESAARGVIILLSARDKR